MKLSVCIATFNRADFIGQTLDAIVGQLTAEVELVVVDGASRDHTADVMARFLLRHPQIVYHREVENSGVDRDFDKAVGYARGDYCWLMSDDDIIAPDAIAKVLEQLVDSPALLIVNAEIRDKSLTTVLKDRQLAVYEDARFDPGGDEAFFALAAGYLSFIGGVVISRQAWLARAREAYYGSLFIHVGVMYQQPALGRIKVLAEPLVQIRYGNAMWSARGFDIWTRMWPDLVWSFAHFSEIARTTVTMRHPATRLITLLWFRGVGAYGPDELARMRRDGTPHHRLAGLAARLPARLLNAGLAMVSFASRHRDSPMKLYDLSRASCAAGLTRWLARRSRFPETEK